MLSFKCYKFIAEFFFFCKGVKKVYFFLRNLGTRCFSTHLISFPFHSYLNIFKYLLHRWEMSLQTSVLSWLSWAQHFRKWKKKGDIYIPLLWHYHCIGGDSFRAVWGCKDVLKGHYMKNWGLDATCCGVAWPLVSATALTYCFLMGRSSSKPATFKLSHSLLCLSLPSVCGQLLYTHSWAWSSSAVSHLHPLFNKIQYIIENRWVISVRIE